MQIRILAALLAVSLTTAHAQNLPSRVAGVPSSNNFDETAQFIFYSVLEGLYEDGLSNEDVDQILMRNEGQKYFHFVYACPICTPTIWALETYRNRPKSFYSVKMGGSTFGPGLPPGLKKQLYSPDSNQRLIAINTLSRDWMQRRLDRTKMSDEQRKALLAALEEKRKDGMRALESFRNKEHGTGFGIDFAAPAYANLEECAVCNGAVGNVMKLPDTKPQK